MSAEILDGKTLATEIKEKIKGQIGSLSKKPGLAIILVGSDYASKMYVKKKEDACKELGIYSEKYELPASVEEQELIRLVERLNGDKKIHGILVQLPLPPRINTNRIMEAILPAKDVDGFNPENVGRLFKGGEILVPCTPKGIIRLLEKYNIELPGKHVVVVGRSNIVGKPVAALFLHRDATVTICHSKTRNLPEITKNADILVSATGKPKLITSDMVKNGAIVVDVGITRTGNKLTGDVDFEKVKDIASAITPVPGGIGPMTVAMLMENLLLCYNLQSSGNTKPQ